METFTPLWWHWCTLGLVLVALEMVMPGVFLLWIGAGAMATGAVVGVLGIHSWEIQCLVFVALAFASLFLGRRFIRKAAPAEDSTLNRRLTSYIGRRAEVTQAIVHGAGRIRLGDTVWIAKGEDCPAGTMVTVTGVSGSELLVAPVAPDNPQPSLEPHDK